MIGEKPGGMKELFNQREKQFFSPLACFSENGIRRRPDPGFDAGYRQAFGADADRILNSLAYTRYIDKTQVFSLIKNDHITHRVLHVQLVSRIARTIGRYLGLNEDLIEAAAIGHDIGHPPFGHDGETFLSELCDASGIGSFLHNVQSLQFLDKIERNGQGWNLTLQTLDAILCHNGEIHTDRLKPERNKTFKDLDNTIQALKKKEKFDAVPMTMEGCVVRMADTIGYIGRDFEDGIRLGLIDRKDIPEICAATLGKTNGTIVYTLVTDLIRHSFHEPFLCFSPDISQALKTLKAFNYKYIYKNPRIKNHLTSVKDIFHYLFNTFLNDLEHENTASPVFTSFLENLSESYRKAHSNPEIVRDFIAGMTDSFFIRQAPLKMKPECIEL